MHKKETKKQLREKEQALKNLRVSNTSLIQAASPKFCEGCSDYGKCFGRQESICKKLP